MIDRLFTAIASRTAAAAGRPPAFVIACVLILIWIATGPLFDYSDTWQLVINTSTTIITFLMVFVIQNSQNRDAAALQAKLDELIRVSRNARNEFIGIEHLTDAEVEAIRAHLEQDVGQIQSARHARHATVRRMQKRL